LEKFAYLRNANAEYIEELLQRFKTNPDTVDESWRWFFEGMEMGEEEANLASDKTKTAGNGHGKIATVTPIESSVDFSSEAKVAELITAYRERGRLLSNLDPLSDAPKSHPLLELSNFGLSEKDLNRKFTAGRLIGLSTSTLTEILNVLHKTYCSSIAVEFTHIQDPKARAWLCEKMESTQNKELLSPSTKKHILKRLSESELFEQFLHTRYVAQKRFSVEGGESLIPMLDRIIDVSAGHGAEQIVVGMAHRGRLNVLHNIFDKNAEHIFTEYEQNYDQESSIEEGDVKYHMGFSKDAKTISGKSVHLSLAHNPSHLEFVDPVVIGIARAKQRHLNDTECNKVLPILIHGDAAFAGQGIVYETLNLSQLEGYKVGGAIHVVIDNQIGFTTNPTDSRSTTYSTDVAKMLEVPIFHVNGDDVESVCYIAKLAGEWRQQFKSDVVIDLKCYRKYGHNEGEEPSFTQPLMYKKIKSHPSTKKIYSNRLISERIVSEDDVSAQDKEIITKLENAQKTTRSENPKPFSSSYENLWKGLRKGEYEDMFSPIETKVDEKTLKVLASKILSVPSGFSIHPKLKRIFDAREKMIETGENLDWATGELLAYASILNDGFSARLSGQDIQRGTFSHRHAVLHDFENGNSFTPLSVISNDTTAFQIYNSSLSEAAVLGFEYGWSLTDPRALVIWEAQFGDFANGAQVIIDQFISSSESKWKRASGIVLYLPHGYEGQGPEHSSARLERFLQLSGKFNINVCNFTNSAQLFHALRRQMIREFRKPLIIMTPKSLLRNPKAICSLSDLSTGKFHEVLQDPKFISADKSKVSRILICSGKMYYDLDTVREEKKIENVAILRLEQLYPFHQDLLAQLIGEYSAKAEIAWVQEEPRNMGAWPNIMSYWYGGLGKAFAEQVGRRPIMYFGREKGAAPAVGSGKLHQQEQKEIVEKSLGC